MSIDTQLLSHVLVEPSQGEANASVIWLHGLGANGHDFEPIVPHLPLSDDLRVRFIFPHAPNLAVTINGGMAMPAWYDIVNMSIEREVDVKQLRQSAQWVHDFIRHEIQAGIPAERIVVAGFSQGGAVAYEAGLTFDAPLAGIMALSTYAATQADIQRQEAQAKTPVLIHHGFQDPIVPMQLGEQAHAWLKGLGYAVEYQTYPMAHQVCPEQIQDIGRWLSKVLA